MIDRTVKTLFEANAQQCGHQAKSHCIVVRWNDAPIGHFLANYDGGLSFEYTIDIEPGPASELGLKSVLYKNEEKVCNGNTIVGGTHLSTHGQAPDIKTLRQMIIFLFASPLPLTYLNFKMKLNTRLQKAFGYAEEYLSSFNFCKEYPLST